MIIGAAGVRPVTGLPVPSSKVTTIFAFFPYTLETCSNQGTEGSGLLTVSTVEVVLSASCPGPPQFGGLRSRLTDHDAGGVHDRDQAAAVAGALERHQVALGSEPSSGPLNHSSPPRTTHSVAEDW
jgi:hypothetical protein